MDNPSITILIYTQYNTHYVVGIKFVNCLITQVKTISNDLTSYWTECFDSTKA